MGRMRTRHVFFSVSHDDNPLPNDTVLVCEATDPLSMGHAKVSCLWSLRVGKTLNAKSNPSNW